MDYVETKALKTSLWPETTFKQNPQVLSDDLWCGNGVNDDLFVEGLLDFSNEEDELVVDEKEEVKGKGLGSGLGMGLDKGFEDNPNTNTHSNSNSSDIKDEFGSGSGSGSVPGSELSVPADDVADLEWLSHFVEDSFSEFTLQHQSSQKTEEREKLQTGCERVSGPPRPVSVIPASFPSKARRSKRSRTGGRVWSFGSLSLPELSTCSSSSSSSTSSSTSSSCLIFNNPDMGHWFRYMENTKPIKKVKKRVMTEAQLQRRCSHCGVQKTPQWRAGPLGSKTLCNACGVRFKSGRLLPEYRPACSPTFSREVHSNNHRKVLEMRRKKEGTMLSDRNFQVV